MIDAQLGIDQSAEPLVSAIERDEPNRLRCMLNENLSEKPANRFGPQLLAKCLYVAAARGRVECARIMLEARAQPDVRGDTNGNTPLIVATRGGEEEIVAALIAAGCDVNKPSKMARSRAIHWAVSSTDCAGSMSCLRQLLSAGADIEAKVTSGRTPLMMAARAGHQEAVNELIKHGANVIGMDCDRATALHLAAEEGFEECVRCLIAAGCDVMAETRRGETPLSLAARNGHEDVVRLLIEVTDSETLSTNRKPRRWQRSLKGQHLSPVHWAAAQGHPRCVALLMTSSTWRQVADAPITTAYESGNLVTPMGTTPLMLAAKAGNSEIIRILTNHEKIDVDRQDDDDMTALLYAVQVDHYSCVESLLSAGANQDGVSSICYRLSPAVLAATSDSVRSLRVLLQGGCRLDLLGRSSRHGDDVILLDLISNSHSLKSDRIRRLLSAAVDLEKQEFQDLAGRRKFHHSTSMECGIFYTALTGGRQPTTLCSIIRQRIRRHLVNTGRYGGLFVSVRQLPIPNALKYYLLFDELVDIV